MTEAEFWSSTFAQLVALLPPAEEAAGVEQGTGADLLAMAEFGR